MSYGKDHKLSKEEMKMVRKQGAEHPYQSGKYKLKVI